MQRTFTCRKYARAYHSSRAFAAPGRRFPRPTYARYLRATAKLWLSRYQQRYSPSVINNSIGTLRAIFDEAIGSGARFNNPAAGLSRVKIRQKRLELRVLKFVDVMRNADARQSKDCANLVCFLAYSGVRIGEAKHVTRADADFARRQLHVRGDPETATKNGETRFVPMIPDLERMLTELRAERAEEPANATVMLVFECQNSMTHAAEKIGMKRITHHDLRHLFATICIESGVHIPTVSRWLGHKDGGALCMKTYCVVKSTLSGDSRADNRGHAKSLIGPPKHRGVGGTHRSRAMIHYSRC
jgi:integrase